VIERLTVGLAQWLPGRDAGANLEDALGAIGELARSGAQLVVLPELWPCGYRLESLRDDARRAAEPLDGPRGRALAAAAAEHGLWLCAGSVPELDGGAVFNTAVLYGPTGQLVASHRKVHLYEAGGEPDAFAAGERLTVCRAGGLGPVGLVVCFDGDFPEVAAKLRAAGARIVLEPSAYEEAAETWWERLYPAHAMHNGQWWVLANQCGRAGDTAMLGRSRIVSPLGDVVAEARRVRASGADPGEMELLVQTIDLAAGCARSDDELAALHGGARAGLEVAIEPA
jgi:predicted amidohydrolase